MAQGGGGGQGVGVTQAQAAVAFALSYVGTPYVWGGTSPGKGLDCSGLCSVAYKHAGMYIPRTTFTEYAFPGLLPVSRANLQPGDLLFYYKNDGGKGPGHVVMYTGDMKIVQAAHSGTKVAQSDVFWQGFVGARRHVKANQAFSGQLPAGARSSVVATDLGFPGSGVVKGAGAAVGFLANLPHYLEMAGGGAVLLLGTGIGIYGATGRKPQSDVAQVQGVQRKRAAASERVSDQEEREFRAEAAAARGQERRTVARERRGEPPPRGQTPGPGAARPRPGSRKPKKMRVVAVK